MRRTLVLGLATAAALTAPAGAWAHGREVPVSRLAGAWHAPPLVLGGAALLALLFAQAFVRLRRRGRTDHATWWRPVLFTAGLALGVLPLVSPLDAVGDSYLLSAHMLQHMLIGDAAPALVLLALRGPLIFFLLPPPLLRVVAPLRPLRALGNLLLRPWVSFWTWVAAMLAWHVPGAYDYTLSHRLAHNLEHATFILGGTLVWMQLVDPARQGRLSRPGRIAFAVGVFALTQPIADALLFSGTPAYRPYALQPYRLLGLSPLGDQRAAAIVMMAEQLLTLGTCTAFLLWPYLRRARRRETALAA